MNTRWFWFALGLGAAGGAGMWMGCHTHRADQSSVEDEGDDNEPSIEGLDEGDGGDTPVFSGGADLLTKVPSKVRYVLVLIKENHTFDNYFTGFPGAETSETATLSTGEIVQRPEAPDGPLPQDICHANSCGQRAYAHGAMNGFDLNGAGRELPFIRYTERQIPNYWQYARNFVLADHFFSTTLGPSSPGHQVFWTSRSMTLDNAKCDTPDGGGCSGSGCTSVMNSITAFDPVTCSTSRVEPCFDVPALPDHLPANFTWMDYGGATATMVKSVTDDPHYRAHFRSARLLRDDLEAGHIANLTIAHLSSGELSEHPAVSPCVGENFSVDIINAAMRLPQWNEMAIVLTWDDWGGFYDHVPPPVYTCDNGKVFRSGFRLPMILISPFAKRGFVLSSPAEQASVPRLVEELWGLRFMSYRDPNARDGVAGTLMGGFDFDQTPRPPLLLEKHACPLAEAPQPPG